MAKNRAVKDAVERMKSNLGDLAVKIASENTDLRSLINLKIKDLDGLELEISQITQKKEFLQEGKAKPEEQDAETQKQVDLIYQDWEKRRSKIVGKLKLDLIELQNSKQRLS